LTGSSGRPDQQIGSAALILSRACSNCGSAKGARTGIYQARANTAAALAAADIEHLFAPLG
jgi:hypothetical protein